MQEKRLFRETMYGICSGEGRRDTLPYIAAFGRLSRADGFRTEVTYLQLIHTVSQPMRYRDGKERNGHKPVTF